MEHKTHSDYILEWARRGDRISELEQQISMQAKQLRECKKVAIALAVSWIALAIISVLS